MILSFDKSSILFKILLTLQKEISQTIISNLSDVLKNLYSIFHKIYFFISFKLL